MADVAEKPRPIDERRKILSQATDVLEANAGQLARLLTQEQGKPLPEAEGEIAGTIGFDMLVR